MVLVETVLRFKKVEVDEEEEDHLRKEEKEEDHLRKLVKEEKEEEVEEVEVRSKKNIK